MSDNLFTTKEAKKVIAKEFGITNFLEITTWQVAKYFTHTFSIHRLIKIEGGTKWFKSIEYWFQKVPIM